MLDKEYEEIKAVFVGDPGIEKNKIILAFKTQQGYLNKEEGKKKKR